jgi:hypothetical protein
MRDHILCVAPREPAVGTRSSVRKNAGRKACNFTGILHSLGLILFESASGLQASVTHPRGTRVRGSGTQPEATARSGVNVESSERCAGSRCEQEVVVGNRASKRYRLGQLAIAS